MSAPRHATRPLHRHRHHALLVYLGCRWLSRTKFGLVQRAIRDGENRVFFSGYATAGFKLFIFVLAALIASVGGALYVPQVGIINPSR
jgi:urea transport system permease protein